MGGLASTGLESRRGFLLTFSLLLQKFSYSLNFSDLIQVIERESVVSKGEKGHVKNCILTGRILLLKSLLDIKNLSSENILTIFKQFVDLFSLKNLDEPLIQVTKIFLNRLLTGFYSDLTDKKRIFKFYDKFFNLFSKILVNKTNFGSIKNLHEFSLIFLFLSFSETSPVKDYFHTNVNENLLSDNSLLNFFKILLSQNVNENQSNTSLELFFNFLKVVNDQKLIFNIWNVLIETSIQDQLKQVSVKNYQFLIYSFSKFLLDNFFIFNYISQIFDSSFFEALLKFNSHKKFKYVNSLVELIMTKIKTLENKDETIKSYSIDMLKIFNTEGGLSTQSYKVFFTFLFNQLDESQKQDYIETLTKNQDEDSLTSRLTSLKQLMVGETELSKDLKDQILEYFFQLYFASESQNDIEFDDFIQDRLLVVILSYLKIPKDETQENKLKPLKDKKIIKLFVQIHKYLQNMITSNKIEDFEMSDYKIYSKYFKKFAVLISDSVKSSEKDKDLIEKKFSIIKIALIVLILFLKNPNEYSDIISDLYLVTKFKDDWQKVYIDILISLLHKGNSKLI